MIDALKKEALRRAMDLMADPRLRKLMADPRVMGAVMQAVSAPARARAGWDRRTRRVARALGFATREEVRALRETIRALERAIEDLRAERADRTTKAPD